MQPAADLVIEIRNGEVVAVTSTDHNLQYVVFNHDTRNHNISPYQVDLCLKPEDIDGHVRELINSQPEKPQEHIKTMLFYCDDTAQSRFTLPDGETLTIELKEDALKGKTLHEKYALMMARIDRYRACSQREMDSATS